MSLPAQNVAPQAVANPGQTIFAFAWRCDDTTTVVVYVNDVQDGGFTVLLNVDQVGNPGGTITRGVACVGGEVVTVERQTPRTQVTDLIRYGAFAAVTIIGVFDRMVELIQELSALIARSFRVSRANASKLASLDLPTPALGTFLSWVDGGGGLFKLGSVALEDVGGVVLRVAPNEVVARTGAGTYQLAHVPSPLINVRLYLNGGRLTLGTHYTISAGGLITQQPGFISDAAEVMIADYNY
jgi:hypothetical protein